MNLICSVFFFLFLPSSGISPCVWTIWAVVLPPTLGAALLCSSWAGSDMLLDPEFDHPLHLYSVLLSHGDTSTQDTVINNHKSNIEQITLWAGLIGSSGIRTHDLSYRASVVVLSVRLGIKCVYKTFKMVNPKNYWFPRFSYQRLQAWSWSKPKIDK